MEQSPSRITFFFRTALAIKEIQRLNAGLRRRYSKRIRFEIKRLAASSVAWPRPRWWVDYVRKTMSCSTSHSCCGARYMFRISREIGRFALRLVKLRVLWF